MMKELMKERNIIPRTRADVDPAENLSDSPDDLERLLMANNAELMKILEDADQRISTTGGIPHDEFWARVERESVKTKGR